MLFFFPEKGRCRNNDIKSVAQCGAFAPDLKVWLDDTPHPKHVLSHNRKGSKSPTMLVLSFLPVTGG